jgi:hypothetical protein
VVNKLVKCVFSLRSSASSTLYADSRRYYFLSRLVIFDFFLDSSPLQYLPNVPGYVPVYIRYGDEPLENINPNLADAFGERSNSIKVSIIRHIRTFAEISKWSSVAAPV